VTTSSKSNDDVKSNRGGRRKNSIQADVSTSSTLALGIGRVGSHLAQFTFPRTGSSQLEDAAGPGAPDEIVQCALNGARIRALAAEAERFIEQLLIQHKIRTFHVYNVTRGDGFSNPARGAGRGLVFGKSSV
jgi:hypothetical protein